MIINDIEHNKYALKFNETGIQIPIKYIKVGLNNLIYMCKEYIKNNVAICHFDDNPINFTLCLTNDDAYVIRNGNILSLIKLKETPIEIIHEIINDICDLDINDTDYFNDNYNLAILINDFKKYKKSL